MHSRLGVMVIFKQRKVKDPRRDTMKLWESVKALEPGKKIRKKDWKSISYINKHSTYSFIFPYVILQECPRFEE
jgi:hypothetical protein